MQKKQAEEILRKNPKTDKRVVEDFEKLAAQLEKLGIDTKSKYTLSPPLGDSVISPKVNSHFFSMKDKEKDS